MSLFMLETDSVTASATSLDSLAQQMSEISSRVSGYDTNCQEFDFSSAKNVIASNIEACSIKIANTAGIMNNVVSSHTSLQNQMQFKSSAEKAAEEAAKKANTQTTSSSGGSSGGGYSGGGYSGGGYSSGGYSSGSTVGGAVATAATAQITPLTSTVETTTVKPTATEPVEIKEHFQKVDHAKVVVDDLSAVGKNLFEQSDLAYNTAGYATLGGMFVVACSEAYGMVGDVLEISLKDGQKFKCIIGQNDETDKEGLRFFVDDNWKEDGKENFQNELGEYITKIENLGVDSTYAVKASVESAVDWAKEVASDDTHGYSQTSRWGDPNYDCSSFVISSYEAVGVPVKEAGATYSGNMKDAFINSGFEWISGTPDVNNLQPGDVLLREGYHTEIYVGDGKMIGAHSNTDGQDGDSSGGEISITDYSDKQWDGVLRYVGNGIEKGSDVPTAPRVGVVETETTEQSTDEQTTDTSSTKSDDDITKLLNRISGTL